MSTQNRTSTGLRPSAVATALLLAGVAVQSGVHAEAHAECALDGVEGSVNILGNEFPALQGIMEVATACAGDGLTVEANLNKEHRDIQVAALTADPSEYTGAFVANGSLVPLMNDDLVRPLNDLVEQFGEGISERQKIVVDGQVMAIAFMANAQHLMYRKDLLEEAGVEPPTTYEDVLAAAAKLQESGVEYPLAGTYKSGWDLGEEFVNMYMGYGGQLFKDGTAEPNLDTEEATQALETMKALTGFMNPDYLTFDSNAASAEYEAGTVAIMNMWGSRAGAITDDEGAEEGVAESTVFAAAPMVGGGDAPATTLWWDGFVISKNISDEDAEATFRVLAQALSSETANANADAAVWLIDGFEPTATAEGVLATAAGGAKPYPMVPYIGLMHTALGDELVGFLQGSESAEEALKDVSSSYTTAAKEAGFL